MKQKKFIESDFEFTLRKTLICNLFIFIYGMCYCGASCEVLRPRGVPLSNKVFYIPHKDFSCIDGSNVIPFSFVNDDYCDCEDGSDEPGTAACPNAFFHCVNSGFTSLDIPSSRVNDNICDCCDGSDEYNSTADCLNICTELGRKAREEQEKQQELYEVGFGLWQQYSAQGKQMKENNKVKLEGLMQTEIENEKVKDDKEVLKNQAEESEKVALDSYKALKEEQVKQQEEIEMLLHQETEKKNAEIAFVELDLDQNDVLTYQELQQFQKFDSNNDGHVSEDEAKFFLHMKESMLLDEFVTTGWMIMKPIYSAKESVTEATETEETAKVTQDSTEINDESDDDSLEDDHLDDPHLDEDLLDDDETDKRPVFPPKEETETTKPEEPEYDEETQKIVDAANNARAEYRSALDTLEKVKEEIKELQAFIDADFGIGEQFAVLKGQCFDFEDREYTYRFCPFDKASQIAKSGGSDVNLGRWGSWAGPEDNKYSKMKFDNGQLCWNGPSRSVMVLLQCGLENKLLSSSEPNRCEYMFEFTTPAMCSLSEEGASPLHRHTEL